MYGTRRPIASASRRARTDVDIYALTDALYAAQEALEMLDAHADARDLRAALSTVRTHIAVTSSLPEPLHATTWDHRGQRSTRIAAQPIAADAGSLILDELGRDSAESILSAHCGRVSRARREIIAAHIADGMTPADAREYARYQMAGAAEHATFAESVLAALTLLEMRLAAQLQQAAETDSHGAVDLAGTLSALIALALIALASIARTNATVHSAPPRPPRSSAHRAPSLAPRAPALPAFA